LGFRCLVRLDAVGKFQADTRDSEYGLQAHRALTLPRISNFLH
jgi:hypothetical protein